MKFRVAGIALVLNLLGSNPVFAQAENPNFNASNIYGTVRLDRLGGESLTIWRDAGSTRYLYPPAIIPNWNGFQREVEEVCSAASPDDELRLKLEISLNEQALENEIYEQLEKKGAQSPVLGAIPHENFELYFSRNGQNILIYEKNADVRLTGVTQAVSHNYKSRVLSDINGNCDELRQILVDARNGEALLSGRLFASGIQYNTSYFRADLTQNIVLNSEKELLGEEFNNGSFRCS